MGFEILILSMELPRDVSEAAARAPHSLATGRSPPKDAGAARRAASGRRRSQLLLPDILKLGDNYYYAGGSRKNDARPALEMSVSK
jgi:hypothetical protein